MLRGDERSKCRDERDGEEYAGSTHDSGSCRQGSIPCSPTKNKTDKLSVLFFCYYDLTLSAVAAIPDEFPFHIGAA